MLEDLTESDGSPAVGLGPAGRGRLADCPRDGAEWRPACAAGRRQSVIAARKRPYLLGHPVRAGVFSGRRGRGVRLSGAASILLLHSIYPSLKRSAARPRPRDMGIACPDAPPPLDRYSFPSGHVMTLTAALAADCARRPASLALRPSRPGRRWRGRGWRSATISLSDVAAGTLIGAGVSGLIAYWIVI